MNPNSECWKGVEKSLFRPLVAKYAPFVAWLGKGCPTPCAVQAQSKGVNPVKFCGNKPTSFNDGGARGWYDCRANCRENCVKQKYCKWNSVGCVSLYRSVCFSQDLCSQCYGAKSPCCTTGPRCAICFAQNKPCLAPTTAPTIPVPG